MTRGWKPGDVALVRLSTRDKAETAIFDGAVWLVRKGATADPIEPPRPLVVIDPEDESVIGGLVRAWVAAKDRLFSDGAVLAEHEFGEALKAALRSLVTPPKPEEPTGLGAVVEDAEGLLWVRREAEVWHWGHVDKWRKWEEVVAVKVLSEGVTA